MTAVVAKRDVDLTEIAAAGKLLPWEVVDISQRPSGLFSFNPSVHFDGVTWRCVLRCADYGMPLGQLVRTHGARARVESRSMMLVLDPDTWQPAGMHLMSEADGTPRNPQCASTGFEDLRLFGTSDGSLWAIAASLHLQREGDKGASVPPEQVLLAIDPDNEHAIVGAQTIRGPWSATAQKNWMPFEGCDAPRFLYSIEKGVVFSLEGPERPTGNGLRPLDHALKNVGGTEVRMMRRPIQMSSGKVSAPSYGGLRGGSQLLPINDGASFLGIGHEMRYVRGKKWYWHTFFTCDASGALEEVSPPVKLAPQGIEFAAGIAISNDRLVVSFGVDDSESKLAVTSLSAVLELLAPAVAEAPVLKRTFSDGVKTFDPKIPTRVYATVGIDPQPAMPAPSVSSALAAKSPTGLGPHQAASTGDLDVDQAMAAVLDGTILLGQARVTSGASRGAVLLDAARMAIYAQRTEHVTTAQRDLVWTKLLAAIEAYGDCFYDAAGKPRTL